MKIRTKLILSYILIVVIALCIVGVAFNAFMQRYLIKEAQKGLSEEGRKIAEIYQRVKGGAEGRLLPAGKITLAFTSHLVEADFVIFNKDKNVVYTPGRMDKLKEKLVYNIGNRLNSDRENKMVLNLADQKLVVVSVPFVKDKAGEQGWVVVFTRLSGIKIIRRRVALILVRAFALSALGAVIMGILLSKTIIKPLKQLSAKANYMAKMDFRQRIRLKTNDEIQELGESFNYMGEQLEKYYDAQKRIIQNLSHDFKTPLMSIQGYAEGIMEGVIDKGEEQEEALKIIVDESQRLKCMVDEVIYLSKLETFEEIYKKTKQELFPIVQDSIKKIKSLSDKNGITVSIEEFDHGELLLDRNKIIQAFVNVLSNSIRYARSQVIIKGKVDGNHMVLLVEDDGPGLENGDDKRIFERFHKGYKGDTGLGLAITKTIVESHGGTVEAENRKEGGCRFVLRFPMA